jgi:glycerophosphoryl diester phosphodiesterase
VVDVLEALSRKPFAIVGHRGAKGLAPENTLDALEAAVRSGADIAEFDVQRTADGVLVASHDPVVLLEDGSKVNIRSTPFNSIRGRRLRGGGEIPAIEEVVEAARDRIALFLEVKEPSDTKPLIELLRRKRTVRDAAIISFHVEAVEQAKKLSPYTPAGLIYVKPPGLIVECKKLKCEIVLPRYPLATPKAIAFAHRLGLRVVAWTINDEKLMVEYAKRGVDAIATDRPDLAARVRELLAAGGSAKGGLPHGW